MAHDLFFKNSQRNWSRQSGDSSATGYEPYARSIFERRGSNSPSCSEQPVIVVKPEPRRMGWLGYTAVAMFSTRILSGKWPWYWAGLAAKKLESPQKG
jgi:hypothetical protein